MLDYGFVTVGDLVGGKIVCSQCGATAYYPATQEGTEDATIVGGFNNINGLVYCSVCAREYDRRRTERMERNKAAAAQVRAGDYRFVTFSDVSLSWGALICSCCKRMEPCDGSHGALSAVNEMGWRNIAGRVHCAACARKHDRLSYPQHESKAKAAADWRTFTEEVKKISEKSLDSGRPAVIIRVVKDKPMVANTFVENRKMTTTEGRTNGNGRKHVETRARELLALAQSIKAAVAEGKRPVIEQADLQELVELGKKIKIAASDIGDAKDIVTELVAQGAIVETGPLSIQRQEEKGSRSWSDIVKKTFGLEKYNTLLNDNQPKTYLRWRIVDALTGKRVDD